MRYPKIEFDRLRIYFGKPYEIDLDGVRGKIVVKSPTIGKILDVGEEKFNVALSVLTGNTTQFRKVLWDVGFDWNETSDFEMFCLMYKAIDDSVCELFFDNLLLSNFDVYSKQNSGDTVLYDNVHNIEINEDVYQNFHQYFQHVFQTFPEEKLTKDKFLKKWWIEKDERQEARDKDKGKGFGSLQPLISAYVNHPATKYSLSELENVGVAEFFDSIQRIRLYESATALMKGLYSGFVDGKKIKPEDYDFMRELN